MAAVLTVLREAGEQWVADKASRMGAALAYYSLFSLAPLVVLAIGLAGLVFGEQAAQGGLAHQLERTVGHPAAAAIEEMVKQVHLRQEGRWATIVGLIVLFFGASSVCVQLQDALNTIWKVEPRPGRTLWTLVRDRLVSFVIVLATGFLLLASLVATAALAALVHWLNASSLPGGTTLWQAANRLISFVLMTVLFGLLYKLLPDVKVPWRDVAVGAIVTALLFTLGKYLLSLYLERSGTASAFGAAASLVVLLIWVYYSAQILLFGAEIVRAFSRHYNSVIVPSDNARFTLETSRDGQGSAQPRESQVR